MIAATTVALVDQADAATRHAHQVVHAMASRQGTNVTHNASPGPITRGLIAKMHARMLSNELDGHPALCPHLSYRRPAVGFWCAYAPGKIRCAGCAHRAVRRIEGTSEDSRCDHCRKLTRTIHPDAVQLPALVASLSRAAAAIPAIIVLYGLCPGCQQVDQRRDTGGGP